MKTKRKLLASLVVVLLVVSSVIPIFAATSDHSDFNRDKLRDVVASQTTSVAGLIAGVLPEDTIKGLVKDAVSGMLDLSDIGGFAGPALADLLGKTLSDYGITIPDSVNIGDIINDVLSKEYVT